jgi:hypothetical protein
MIKKLDYKLIKNQAEHIFEQNGFTTLPKSINGGKLNA